MIHVCICDLLIFNPSVPSQDFTEKRFLNDHVQTAHAGSVGGGGGGPGGCEGVPLKCPNCFREFAYKTSLKQHLKKQASLMHYHASVPASLLSANF